MALLQHVLRDRIYLQCRICLPLTQTVNCTITVLKFYKSIFSFPPFCVEQTHLHLLFTKPAFRVAFKLSTFIFSAINQLNTCLNNGYHLIPKSGLLNSLILLKWTIFHLFCHNLHVPFFVYQNPSNTKTQLNKPQTHYLL